MYCTRKLTHTMAGLLILAAAGCDHLTVNVGAGDGGRETLAVRSPESTARGVLDRYRRKDAFGLYAMASKENKDRYRRLHHNKENDPEWNEVFGGWRLQAVDAFHGMPGPTRYWRDGETYRARVEFRRAADRSVVTVSLRLESRRWRFEEIQRIAPDEWEGGATSVASLQNTPPAPVRVATPAPRPKPLAAPRTVQPVADPTPLEEPVPGPVARPEPGARTRSVAGGPHPKVTGVAVESPRNDGPESADLVALGKPFRTAITPLEDRDWFKVRIGRQGYLRVVVKNVSGVEPSAQFLTWDAFSGTKELTEEREIPAACQVTAPGEYYICIKDRWDNKTSSRPFEVKVEFLEEMDPAEPDNSPKDASPLQLGMPVSEAIFPAGDQDWYALEVPRRGYVVVEARNIPEGLDPIQQIFTWDAWKGARAVNGDRPVGNAIQINTPGAYYLRVQNEFDDKESARPFQLRVSMLEEMDSAEPNNTPSGAAAAEFSVPYTLALCPAGDHDWYKVKVSQQGYIAVEARDPPALDLQHQVCKLGPDGKIVAVSKDWSLHSNHATRVTQAGTYFVDIHEQWGDNWSPKPFAMRFTFTPEMDPAEPNDTPAEAKALHLRSPVSMALFPTGDHDFWKVDAPGACTLKVLARNLPGFTVQVRALRPTEPGRKELAEVTPFADIPATVGLPAKGGYVLEFKAEWDDNDSAASPTPFQVLVTALGKNGRPLAGAGQTPPQPHQPLQHAQAVQHAPPAFHGSQHAPPHPTPHSVPTLHLAPAQSTQPASPAAPCVVLIHGWGGDHRQMDALEKSLERAGTRTFNVTLSGGLWQKGVAGYARDLQQLVAKQKVPPKPRITVVAYSMGGVIARWWIEKLGGDAVVGRLVTICSPHHGTYLGVMTRLGKAMTGGAAGRGTATDVAVGGDLAAPSPTIMALRDSRSPRVEYHAIWLATDKVVLPPASAMLSGARNYRIDGRGLRHVGIEKSPAVILLVEAILKGTARPSGPQRLTVRDYFEIGIGTPADFRAAGAADQAAIINGLLERLVVGNRREQRILNLISVARPEAVRSIHADSVWKKFQGPELHKAYSAFGPVAPVLCALARNSLQIITRDVDAAAITAASMEQRRRLLAILLAAPIVQPGKEKVLLILEVTQKTGGNDAVARLVHSAGGPAPFKKHFQVHNALRERLLRMLPITVPSVIGKIKLAAEKTVRDAGLRPKVRGKWGKVTGQSPRSGTQASYGATVEIRLRH